MKKKIISILLLFILIILILNSCSDNEDIITTSPDDDPTISTADPNFTGRYRLYWLEYPTGYPTGKQFTVEVEELEPGAFNHNEYEYTRPANAINIETPDENGVLVSKYGWRVSKGRVTNDTFDEAALTNDGRFLVPFYNNDKPKEYYIYDGTDLLGNEEFAERGDRVLYYATDDRGELKLMEFSHDTLDYRIIELEFPEGENTSIEWISTDSLKSTYDGGFSAIYLRDRDSTHGCDDFSLGCWDADGKLIFSYPMEMFREFTGGYSYFGINLLGEIRYNYYVAQNGIFFMSSARKYYVYSHDGEFLYLDSSPHGINSRLALDPDGNAVVLDTKGTTYVVREFVHEAKSLGQGTELPAEITKNFYLGKEYDAVWYNSVNIMAGNVGKKPEILMSWDEYDLKYSQIEELKVIDEDHIMIWVEDPTSDAGIPKIGVLTTDDIEGKEAARVMKKRTTLTLAYVAGSNAINPKAIADYISSFNETNKKYYIKPLYYTTDGTLSANNTLIRDILSGEIPDLIMFDDDMSPEAFAPLDIFVDLYTYMDKDENHSRDTFFPCVLGPFENADGELTSLTIRYGLSTVVSASKTVGGREAWSLTEMADFTKKLGKNYLIDYYYPMKAYTPMILLERMLPDMMNSYVDYEEEKASFGGELAKLLELCKTAPIYMEGTALQKQYASGEVAVRFNQSITTMTNFLSMKYAYFNGVDVEYIGYPTNGANGSAIIPIESLAITTSCKTPDGAWEFLTHCLDCMYEDWAYTAPIVHEGIDWVEYPELEAKAGFSCEKRTVERMFDTLSHYYYTVQEMGASVDDNYTSYNTWVTHLDIDGGWRKNRQDGANYTLSEADKADFLRLLDTVTLVRSFDTALMDIIYEDAQAYFGGIKSLDETVKIIENRMKIKLAE